MNRIKIRTLSENDEKIFLEAMLRSEAFHHPWVKPPVSSEVFQDYYLKYQKLNNVCYLVCNELDDIVGVFNISEIILGVFKSAYLGYFAVQGYENKGYMSQGLKLVLEQVFTQHGLHRLEANIQPNNLQSIYLAQNNGFQKEGYSPRYLKIDDEWKDHERWAITYEDWVNFKNQDKVENK